VVYGWCVGGVGWVFVVVGGVWVVVGGVWVKASYLKVVCLHMGGRLAYV
jgi:hypothetical protein